MKFNSTWLFICNNNIGGDFNMRYIGVNLHTNIFFTVCYLQEVLLEKHTTYALKSIGEFIKSLNKINKVTLKAKGNAYFFLHMIKDCVKKVISIFTHHFEIIKPSTKKTDKHDAIKIASFLSKGMLLECRIRKDVKIKIQNNFYNRIQARRGSGQPIVATAKKLLGIIYQTLNKFKGIEDFPSFLLKSS